MHKDSYLRTYVRTYVHTGFVYVSRNRVPMQRDLLPYMLYEDAAHCMCAQGMVKHRIHASVTCSACCAALQYTEVAIRHIEGQLRRCTAHAGVGACASKRISCVVTFH